MLFVSVSRYAVHHDNIVTRWLTSYSFEQLHLNFVLYIALEKDTQGKLPKKEVANVFRFFKQTENNHTLSQSSHVSVMANL